MTGDAAAGWSDPWRECCELRIKDIDFDQGLVFVRSGKGDKDRSTLLPEAGREELRRHLRAAHDARIHKPVSVHTLRHCFAIHLLLNGVDIRQSQEYLGHTNVETTMVYTHVVRDLRTPARSPLDLRQVPEDGAPTRRG